MSANHDHPAPTLTSVPSNAIGVQQVFLKRRLNSPIIGMVDGTSWDIKVTGDVSVASLYSNLARRKCQNDSDE